MTPQRVHGLIAAALAFMILPARPAEWVDSLDAKLTGTSVSAAVTQPDGKLIIAGKFSAVRGVPRGNIARVNADGTLDPDFDPSLSGGIHCIALQPDGKILLGGDFTSLSPNGASPPIKREHFARLNSQIDVKQ